MSISTNFSALLFDSYKSLPYRTFTEVTTLLHCTKGAEHSKHVYKQVKPVGSFRTSWYHWCLFILPLLSVIVCRCKGVCMLVCMCGPVACGAEGSVRTATEWWMCVQWGEPGLTALTLSLHCLCACMCVCERETQKLINRADIMCIWVHYKCRSRCNCLCTYHLLHINVYLCTCVCGILKARRDSSSLFLISLILAHPDTPHALSVTLLPLITNLIVSPPRQVRAVRIKAPLPSFSLSYSSLSSSTSSSSSLSSR